MNGKKRLIDDFTISDDNDDTNDISAALYKEQLNDRKIEKLGNRVTIISIMLPFLIGAILVYGYIDIKNRVMTIHDSGQTQVDVVAKEVESKINGIEVELAKIKFTLEKDIPELKQEIIAIQDELTLIAGNKAGKDDINKNFELLKADIAKVADQYQGALHILDRTNQETLAIINENSKKLDAKIEEKTASLNNIQTNIESKIDSKIETLVQSNIQTLIDKKIESAIMKQIAENNQALNKKVADIELSVESKLAALQEVTEILSENNTDIKELQTGLKSIKTNMTDIAELQTSLKSIKTNIADLDKELKNAAGNLTKADIDKIYVDSEINSLKKSLNYKIDQLNLTLSKKILQYSIQVENSVKKKTESSRNNNKSSIILNPAEKGKISEKDLIQ